MLLVCRERKGAREAERGEEGVGVGVGEREQERGRGEDVRKGIEGEVGGEVVGEG